VQDYGWRSTAVLVDGGSRHVGPKRLLGKPVTTTAKAARQISISSEGSAFLYIGSFPKAFSSTIHFFLPHAGPVMPYAGEVLGRAWVRI